MYSTRSNTATATKKPTRTSEHSSQQQEQDSAEANCPTTNVSKADQDDLDEGELEQLMNTITPESKTLVKILTIIISKQSRCELKTIRDELTEKDKQITQLKKDVIEMKDKLADLETQVDDAEQYERRDTIIISGPSLPSETSAENPANTVINTIKDTLKININTNDINIAHRLGPKHQQTSRPMIVKLTNRSLKQDIMTACVNIKPNLYINESLTPKRLKIYKQVLHIRKVHKNKFQQCFTKNGRIMIKLKNSTVRHVVVDELTFKRFLEKYPDMMDTYQESLSDNQ